MGKVLGWGGGVCLFVYALMLERCRLACVCGASWIGCACGEGVFTPNMPEQVLLLCSLVVCLCDLAQIMEIFVVSCTELLEVLYF